MSKNLQLSLKKQWFDMTNAEIKPEDYREITAYWVTRLTGFGRKTLAEREWIAYDFEHIKASEKEYNLSCIKRLESYMEKFETNTMTLGYPSKSDTDRIIQFKHAGIEIRTGRPEWGAVEGKLYFVIKHGERIKGPTKLNSSLS